MSAETLRRAAKRLRGYATMLPGALADRPWRVVQSDSENMNGVAACSDHGDVEPTRACDACWDMVTPHWQAARYVALMHPPVALFMADLLDEFADSVEQEGGIVQDSATAGAVNVARAVLREEPS